MRARRAIRAGAWALVVAGLAAPALRRRLPLPPGAVVGIAAAAVPASAVVAPRGRTRVIVVGCVNMWAYLAAYELPHDDAATQAQRVRIDYPIAVDRILGLGELPLLRLLRVGSRPGEINRLQRALTWCHWVWFMVPHATVAYVLWRAPERCASAAARMYAVFDLGAVFYWAIPTAPPWYAYQRGRLHDRHETEVRRTMIEYGERFWGERWPALYDVLGGNPLAAMPSLHFATSLMAAHLLSEMGPAAGAVGWSYLVALGLALVYLGEHYVADLLGGALLTETIRRASPAVAPAARRLSARLDLLSTAARGA